MAEKKVENLDGSMTLAEIKAAARKIVTDKHNKVAIDRLRILYEQEALAEKALANLRREINDVEAQIEEGSFHASRI